PPPAPVPTMATSQRSRMSPACCIPWMIMRSHDLAVIDGRDRQREPLRPGPLETGQRTGGVYHVREVVHRALERLERGAPQLEAAAGRAVQVREAGGGSERSETARVPAERRRGLHELQHG